MIRTDLKSILIVCLIAATIFFSGIGLTFTFTSSTYEKTLYELKTEIDTLNIKVDSLLQTTDSLEQVVDVYKRAKLSEIVGVDIPSSFTNKHIDFLEQQCDTFGIPLRIAARLIYAESSYNPRAVSNVGAKGYMQLMPYTYKHFASQLGVTQNNEFSNLKVGVFYLSHLYDMYDGYSETNRWKLALISYNYGPTRIKKNPKKYIKVASNYSYVKKILNI